MTTPAVFYARPESAPTLLRVSPRLASWNRAGDPEQERLARYLEDTADLVAPLVDAHDGPLAIRLDVGVPASTPLLEHHDLDNYVFPLVAHLESQAGPRFVSVWATKRHGEHSQVVIEPAKNRAVRPSSIASVCTTASAESPAYKEQIADQIAALPALPKGPVAMELAFVVGQRNWLNLWKPTIDALGSVLGAASPARAWHPRDGRITELGLHRAGDAALRYDVQLSIAARTA